MGRAKKTELFRSGSRDSQLIQPNSLAEQPIAAVQVPDPVFYFPVRVFHIHRQLLHDESTFFATTSDTPKSDRYDIPYEHLHSLRTFTPWLYTEEIPVDELDDGALPHVSIVQRLLDKKICGDPGPLRSYVVHCFSAFNELEVSFRKDEMGQLPAGFLAELLEAITTDSDVELDGGVRWCESREHKEDAEMKSCEGERADDPDYKGDSKGT
ncbi:hypothetical protein OQA88_4269 [Cercophora sp. LCS_1]